MLQSLVQYKGNYRTYRGKAVKCDQCAFSGSEGRETEKGIKKNTLKKQTQVTWYTAKALETQCFSFP